MEFTNTSMSAKNVCEFDLLSNLLPILLSKKGQHDQRTREILLRDEENYLLGPLYLLIIRLEEA